MFKTLFLRRSILLTSLFSLSLPSFATPTLDRQMADLSPQTLRSQPVKADRLQDKESGSYLTTLGRLTSTAVDALANGVVKAYGLYTIVTLPIVTAFETNLRANSHATALMPISELNQLTQENCRKHFYDHKHCDDLFGNAEIPYSSLAARYAFLPQLSYLEMEATSKNFLQVQLQRRIKSKVKKGHTSKSSFQTKDGDCMDVAFFNVGQGNASVVKPAASQEVWIFDAGSNKEAQNINNDKTFSKGDIGKIIYNYICADTKEKTAHIVLSHPDTDHYNLIPGIFLTDDQDSLKEGCVQKLVFHLSQQYSFKDFKLNQIKLTKDLLDELDLLVKKDSVKNKWDAIRGNHDSLSKLNILIQEQEKLIKADQSKQKNSEDANKKVRDRSRDDNIIPLSLFNKLKDLFEKIEKVKHISQEHVSIKTLTSGLSTIDFLNKGNIYEDKNDNSLVVKVSCGQRSVLFTGDATQQTYEYNDQLGNENTKQYLINRDKIKNIDIYQAAHHGADTEGSNDATLLQWINPSHVVFSAPRIPYKQDWRHPSWKLVEHLNQHLTPVSDVKYLFLDKNMSPIDILAQENKPYVVSYKTEDPEKNRAVYATDKNIYHTGSHGTLIFSVNKNGKIHVKTYDYEAATLTTPQNNLSNVNTELPKKNKILDDDFEKQYESKNNVETTDTTQNNIKGLVENKIKNLKDILSHGEKVKGFRPKQPLDLTILTDQRKNIQAIYLNDLHSHHPDLNLVKKKDVQGKTGLYIRDDKVSKQGRPLDGISIIRVAKDQILDVTQSGIDTQDFFVQQYFGIEP